MKPQSSLTRSQEPTKRTYNVPDESSSQSHTVFIFGIKITALICTSRSAKQSRNFKYSN